MSKSFMPLCLEFIHTKLVSPYRLLFGCMTYTIVWLHDLYENSNPLSIMFFGLDSNKISNPLSQGQTLNEMSKPL